MNMATAQPHPRLPPGYRPFWASRTEVGPDSLRGDVPGFARSTSAMYLHLAFRPWQGELIPGRQVTRRTMTTDIGKRVREVPEASLETAKGDVLPISLAVSENTEPQDER